MNDQDRERFLATLRQDDQFRAAVRRELLTQELLNLPQTVAQLSQDLQALTQTVATLVHVAAEQRQDFTALATDVRGYMERTITLIGDGFTAVRGEISDLRTDMHAGIAELRADMTAGFTAADAKFDQVNAEISDIKRRLAS